MPFGFEAMNTAVPFTRGGFTRATSSRNMSSGRTADWNATASSCRPRFQVVMTVKRKRPIAIGNHPPSRNFAAGAMRAVLIAVGLPISLAALAGLALALRREPLAAWVLASPLVGLLPLVPYYFVAKVPIAAFFVHLVFAGLAPVVAPKVDPANEHIYHQYTIRAERRDQLTVHLKAKGIGHKVYYPLALHQQPCFAFLGYKAGSLPVTEKATAEVVSLPIYPELTDAQQDAVVAAIKGFYNA